MPTDLKTFWEEKILPRLVLDNSTGCMNWTGPKLYGYGLMSHGPRCMRVHRVSLEIKLGKPLGLLHALHHCDNRVCANPDHLFAGTNNDNRNDAIAKGRVSFGVKGKQIWRGEKHGRAKLTEQSVREIRAMIAMGVMQKTIARTYGVSKTAIFNIQIGKYWKTT